MARNDYIEGGTKHLKSEQPYILGAGGSKCFIYTEDKNTQNHFIVQDFLSTFKSNTNCTSYRKYLK